MLTFVACKDSANRIKYQIYLDIFEMQPIFASFEAKIRTSFITSKFWSSKCRKNLFSLLRRDKIRAIAQVFRQFFIVALSLVVRTAERICSVICKFFEFTISFAKIDIFCLTAQIKNKNFLKRSPLISLLALRKAL